MKKFSSSRLERIREKKEIRRAVLFLILSFFLLFLFINWGFPGLIKLAVYLGNLKSNSGNQKDDIIPPPPPTFSFIPEATSSATINLAGFAEPGVKVEIFLNGEKEKEVISLQDGTFSTGTIVLNEGENELYIKAIDNAGNQSQPSEKFKIIYDATPPELIIEKPKDGDTFYNLDNKIEIKGKSEPDVQITVNDHLAIVNPQGEFSYPLTLSLGENKIKIVATDIAGNQTEKEITVYLE
ncbi:MAG: hypothetical protein ACPLKP_00855 [Microgenomates group bacterium]